MLAEPQGVGARLKLLEIEEEGGRERVWIIDGDIAVVRDDVVRDAKSDLVDDTHAVFEKDRRCERDVVASALTLTWAEDLVVSDGDSEPLAE